MSIHFILYRIECHYVTFTGCLYKYMHYIFERRLIKRSKNLICEEKGKRKIFFLTAFYFYLLLFLYSFRSEKLIFTGVWDYADKLGCIGEKLLHNSFMISFYCTKGTDFPVKASPSPYRSFFVSPFKFSN
jgi:hypothetical protein